MKNIAPIAIFTYSRLSLLKKCLKSLKSNHLAKNSKLYVFSDGPKNKKDLIKVKKVRTYLKNLNGFKKIKIIQRKKNYGLAKNITNGITNIINKEGKLIILEDDILVSKNFLYFLNSALVKYYSKKKIWHISGWNYNLKLKITDDAYFTRGMNCWGWATWKNRWKYFEKKPDKILKSWDKNQIYEFNFGNSIKYFSQIVRNQNNSLNSWAIFWYATIFKKNGLCLNPRSTLTQNIGVGKNSTNTNTVEKIFNSKLHGNLRKKYYFPNNIEENYAAYKQIKKQIRINNSFNILKKVMRFI